MTLLKTSLYGLGLCALIACGGGSVDSSDLKTQGIHATIRISASDDTTYVDCRLTAGGPNGSDVELSSGDELTARAYGETKVLEREPQLFGAYDSYLTEFDSNIPGETLVISLVRTEDPDAPNSYITVPAKVTITSPANAEDNVRAIDEDITITWDDNYQGDVDITANITCTTTGMTAESYHSSNTTTIADTGETTVNFYSLIESGDRDSIDTSIDCEGAVYISREVEGVLDSNFDGGNIKMTQNDRVSFILEH